MNPPPYEEIIPSQMSTEKFSWAARKSTESVPFSSAAPLSADDFLHFWGNRTYKSTTGLRLKERSPLWSSDHSGDRFIVPRAGIEPARTFVHWCLRPTRLPIPPSGLIGSAAKIRQLLEVADTDSLHYYYAVHSTTAPYAKHYCFPLVALLVHTAYQ